MTYEGNNGAAADTVNVGKYTVKVKSKEINYGSFEQSVGVEITPAEQTQLTITGKPNLVHYGDLFSLDVTGGSGDGEISWDTNNNGIAEINSSSGLVKVTGVGTVKITVTKAASTDGNYKIATATWTFTAVQATAQWASEPTAASGLIYTRGKQTLLMTGATTVNGIGVVKYSLTQDGEYKTDIPTGENAGTYKVWYKVEDDTNWKGIAPSFVEVTIARKEVSVATISLDGGGGTGETPCLIVKDSDGNTIPPDEYTVTVSTGDWNSGSSFTVTVTAKPDGNYKFEPASSGLLAVASVEVPVGGGSSNTGSSSSTGGTSTSGASRPSTSSTSKPSTAPSTAPKPAEPDTPDGTVPSVQTSVQDGAASTVVNGAAADGLVDEAVENGSEAVVIKPEIDGDVTKTEVTLPASAVGRLGSETDAALTVSTPVADVTIPNGALEALSGAGSNISIVAERVGNTITLTLTADGQELGDIPGGLTLTVPVEDAGPGTVAVIIHEDGTRETVRRSVAGDDGVRIPLNGSATVEIVDNSRKFADVPAENWAADAVAFASAHEMFNGTSETTFSPSLTMSRAMLATVLYNLEGRPEQELTNEFSDVDSGIWYAAAVSWAAANGIAGGYGDGRFGPNNNVTREQLAVMLWRYAGSPATDVQSLDFADADQVSGYALEALCWAAENGILRGYGDGSLNPRGVATRAQAAQMLKNFIENI